MTSKEAEKKPPSELWRRLSEGVYATQAFQFHFYYKPHAIIVDYAHSGALGCHVASFFPGQMVRLAIVANSRSGGSALLTKASAPVANAVCRISDWLLSTIMAT